MQCSKGMSMTAQWTRGGDNQAQKKKWRRKKQKKRTEKKRWRHCLIQILFTQRNQYCAQTFPCMHNAVWMPVTYMAITMHAICEGLKCARKGILLKFVGTFFFLLKKQYKLSWMDLIIHLKYGMTLWAKYHKPINAIIYGTNWRFKSYKKNVDWKKIKWLTEQA